MTINKNKKKEKKEKINKNNVNVSNNIIRRISHYLNERFGLNKLRGLIYYYIHFYLIFMIGFISIFTTSVAFLMIMLVIVSLDAVSIVVLHECPLTTMEQKYLGKTSCDERNELLENAGIMYNCDHNYEKQIELLINVWTTIATKCVSILFFKMFNVKLMDVNNIYVS